MLSDEKLKRSDPRAYHVLLAQRSQAEVNSANTFRASLQASVASLNHPAGVNNLPQRPASGSIRPPPIPSLNPSHRVHSLSTDSDTLPPANGQVRNSAISSLDPPTGLSNPAVPQRPASGTIRPPPSPRSLSGGRAVSAVQAPPGSPDGSQKPRSGLSVPRSSMGASARELSSVSLGKDTSIRSNTPDSPELTSTSPDVAKSVRRSLNTSKVVTAGRSKEESNKPMGSTVPANSSHSSENQKRSNQDIDDGEDHAKDKVRIQNSPSSDITSSNQHSQLLCPLEGLKSVVKEPRQVHCLYKNEVQQPLRSKDLAGEFQEDDAVSLHMPSHNGSDSALTREASKKASVQSVDEMNSSNLDAVPPSSVTASPVRPRRNFIRASLDSLVPFFAR